MFNFPPVYPQPYDFHRPCRPPRPEFDCPWELTPAGMTATVLGIDNCGGLIIRLTRSCDPPPCSRPSRPCK